MKIRLLSDLHLEFHADGGASFVNSLEPAGEDVLVLAGDISNAAGIERALGFIAKRFHETQVLFVMGNHEHYGSQRSRVLASIERAERENENLWHMDCGMREIGGVRFLGTPLWFGKTRADKSAMNDFYQIKRFGEWVYKENDRAKHFLRSVMLPGDVVITHYMPSRRCVHQKYEGSPLNDFFVCEMAPLIEERKPALWLFGHTHESVDMRIGETDLHANPFGYMGHEVNANWTETLILGVP